MLGFVAELGICLYDEFQAGNIPAGAGAVAFMAGCQRQLTDGRRIKAVRSDGAWYQAELFNWREENGILFAVGADKDAAVMRAIGQLAENEWPPLLNKEGVPL